MTAGPGLTNTLTALKNAQLAESPLVAPHVKLVKQVKRVADLGPAVEEALRTAREGVPGPTFVECPVDLLYDEKLIRGWYADAAGKGTSVPDEPYAPSGGKVAPPCPRTPRESPRGER